MLWVLWTSIIIIDPGAITKSETFLCDSQFWRRQSSKDRMSGSPNIMTYIFHLITHLCICQICVLDTFPIYGLNCLVRRQIFKSKCNIVQVLCKRWTECQVSPEKGLVNSRTLNNACRNVIFKVNFKGWLWPWSVHVRGGH